MDSIANHFTANIIRNALWTALRIILRPTCTRLQDFSYTVSKFFPEWLIPPDPRGSVPRCVDPDTDFHVARQRSHALFLFYETTTAILDSAAGETSLLTCCNTPFALMLFKPRFSAVLPPPKTAEKPQTYRENREETVLTATETRRHFVHIVAKLS